MCRKCCVKDCYNGCPYGCQGCTFYRYNPCIQNFRLNHVKINVNHVILLEAVAQ